LQDAVVLAMRDVIPLFIDIDNDPKGICDKFQVRLRPTLVLADQTGVVIRKYEGEAQVPNLQVTVSEFARKHFRDPLWTEPLDRALETARAAGKKVALLFADESDSCRQLVKTLKEPGLKAAREKLVFAKLEFKKDSEEAKRYNVAKPVTLLLLDPSEGKELDRIEGKKPIKTLKSTFDKHLGEK
jgi:hypothetical protein